MSIAMVSSPAYVYMDISQRNETLFMNETWGQPGKTRMNSTQNLGHQCGVHEYIIPTDSPYKVILSRAEAVLKYSWMYGELGGDTIPSYFMVSLLK
jgi:hypothetical protein